MQYTLEFRWPTVQENGALLRKNYHDMSLGYARYVCVNVYSGLKFNFISRRYWL